MIHTSEELTQISINIEKPPIRRDINNQASVEEIERRMNITRELESLGISTSKFSTEDEHEDEDILTAILLAYQGKEIPEELKEKLRKKNNIPSLT